MTAPGVARLAALVGAARRPVFFTGAGVSTESGIPDFRSPGGVWHRIDLNELTYTRFMGGVAGRRRYWQLGRALYHVIRDAAPNRAHRALVDFDRQGRLACCITQNVDDLHRRAGLPAEKIVELHGNATRTRCLNCGARYSRDEVHSWLSDAVEVPSCPLCGGIIKPSTVLFGEAMPAEARGEAERQARAADLFVVVGSSLVVYPAAYLPAHARQGGATLVIINLTSTPYDGQADLVIRGRAGDVLSQVVDHLVLTDSELTRCP
jgi:NAD-dependent protein deacetylase/lipoamidase